ncbi:WbqC family protein [bacterium]|nr:WbqC family protein [bacterium]
MRGTILQPGYLPWLGFFNQMALSDIFVFFDDIQFDRRGWRNRNKIKSPNGPIWLTVPVVQKGKFDQVLLDTAINNTQKWAIKHVKSIEFSYRSSPFFTDLFPGFAEIINGNENNLVELDLALIKRHIELLNLTHVKTWRSSDLDIIDKDKTGRLVEICQKVGITEYISGPLCRNYLDMKLFSAAGISVLLHEYDHPVYKQLYNNFEPYMAAIDLLFNYGPSSLAVLKQENALRDFRECNSGD